MKHGERMLLCALAGLALCTAAHAVTSESSNSATSDSSGGPYQPIVERNVFGLKAPPPPPDPEANKPPPPKIVLTGITTILGNKRALMKMTPPATPGAPAKEQSFTLGEGQRDGELEVLEIDEKAGTVKVNNFGTVTTLNWDDNGVKTAAAPAPAGAPKPAGFVPAPAGNPFAPAGGAQPFPTARPLRLPTPTGAAASPAPGGPGSVTPVYAAGNPPNPGAISTPGLGTASSAASQSQPHTAQPLSAEEQALMLIAQKQRYEKIGSPIARLIPPVPGTSLQAPAAPGNNPVTTTPKPWTPPRAPSLPPLPQ